jgi:hypothetical protein
MPKCYHFALRVCFASLPITPSDFAAETLFSQRYQNLVVMWPNKCKIQLTQFSLIALLVRLLLPHSSISIARPSLPSSALLCLLRAFREGRADTISEPLEQLLLCFTFVVSVFSLYLL